MFVGAQLVKQAAKGPYIALFVVRFLFAKLRGEVEGSADHSLGKLVASQHFSYSQVPNLHLFVLVEENI